MKRISESINLNMRTLISGKYDKDNLMKSLNFTLTELNDVINDINLPGHHDSEELLTRRKYATMLAISSIYSLAVNGMMLFLEDQNNYEFLLDSAAEIQTGDMILEKLANSIKN